MMQSLSTGRIGVIQFEYGGAYLDAGARLREVFDLLTFHGGRLFRIMPYGLEPCVRFEPQMENFQYSNWIARFDGRSA
jgi:hypothetical protein